ncbi:MAG: ATP-binding protein [Clostridia bacterium]|nr:ATP-binding protein [Clostridia bacterium]
MPEITVNASLNEIRTATDFINRQLTEAGCDEWFRIQIDVAIDEILSNIARFAYHQKAGNATVRFETENDPRNIVLTFIDRGTPYDPLTAAIPDISLPAKDRSIGGLGMFMVRKIMDDISYSYQDGQNILTVRKKY